MKFIRESGAILFDDRLIYLNVGDESHMDFHFEQIWPVIKILRKEGITNIRFIHTHPDGIESYSSVDYGLMKAWAIVLYPEPIIFDILTKNTHSMYIVSISNRSVNISDFRNYKKYRTKSFKAIRRFLKKLSYKKQEEHNDA